MLESGSWGHSVLQTPALVASSPEPKGQLTRNLVGNIRVTVDKK